ncbi:MAG: glycine/sarcosine/betaine reductase selenoprotein B family protein [Caldilineaceae bacterium]
MSETKTLWEQLSNRLFAIPAVAQLWAKLTAGRTATLVDLSGAIPFAPLRKPLACCRVALLTTGGIHLPEQPPFDMENPEGDATYRELPAVVDLARVMITHKYYDHSDADADLNVIFPLTHFRDLVAQGVIGGLAPHHYGFMGHIDGDQIPLLNQKSAPAVAAKLRADGVDFAFLTPA